MRFTEFLRELLRELPTKLLTPHMILHFGSLIHSPSNISFYNSKFTLYSCSSRTLSHFRSLLQQQRSSSLISHLSSLISHLSSLISHLSPHISHLSHLTSLISHLSHLYSSAHFSLPELQNSNYFTLFIKVMPDVLCIKHFVFCSASQFEFTFYLNGVIKKL